MAKKAKAEHEKKEKAPTEKSASEEKETKKDRAADDDTLKENRQADCEETDKIGEGQEEITDEAKEADEDLMAKYMRLAADFQNFKRRTENEKKEIYTFANENIVKDFLNVLDNFERAIDRAKESSDQGFADGIVLIYKQFKEVLEKFGTKEIPAFGEDFDPNMHHAVMMDSEAKGESGKITEVLQKGYTLNGRVVRPSMVKVAE